MRDFFTLKVFKKKIEKPLTREDFCGIILKVERRYALVAQWIECPATNR